MKVVYAGPFDEVEVPSAGIVAKRGHQVEVSEEIGKSLIEQDIWRPVPTRSSAKNEENS